MTLVKFNPGKKENPLLPGINDVFDAIFNDTFFNDRMTSRVPAANTSETKDHYHVELAVPGLKKEDFKLSLDHDVLHISVEQRQENKDKQISYRKVEYSYTSFVRSFTLPDSADADRIEASYTDGVLKVDIPKKEESKMIHRLIEIK